jgi:hypothetical protein
MYDIYCCIVRNQLSNILYIFMGANCIVICFSYISALCIALHLIGNKHMPWSQKIEEPAGKKVTWKKLHVVVTGAAARVRSF